MEGTKVEWVKEERVPLIRAVPFYFLNIYVVLKRLQLGSSAGWFTVALILRPTLWPILEVLQPWMERAMLWCFHRPLLHKQSTQGLRRSAFYKVKENPYLNPRSDVCHLELSGANPGKCTFPELEKLQSGIKRMSFEYFSDCFKLKS